MKYIVLPLFIGIFLLSCGSKKNENTEARIIKELDSTVMQVHDRAMPLTGNIFKLKRDLKSLMNTVSDSTQYKILEDAVLDLEKADDAMMDWMHNFATPDSTVSFEDKKAYYEDELIKITEVEKLMINSTEQAQKLLFDFNGNE